MNVLQGRQAAKLYWESFGRLLPETDELTEVTA